MDSQKKYSFILRHLHLIGGVVFVVALVLGLIVDEMERGPAKFEMMFFHKSFGLAVLGLAAFRLLEWLRSPQPSALESYSMWERRGAKVVKIGLYVVMFALPLSGVMMSWFNGYPAAFFGLFELAPMVEKSKMTADIFEDVHKALIPVTFGLLGLHIVGALKHHIFDKDITLSRIAPFSKG